MAKWFMSFLIFHSSYVPLYLLLVILYWDWETLTSVQMGGISILLLFVTSLLSVAVVNCLLKKSTPRHSIKIINVRNRSNDLVNYVLPYIVTFSGIDLFSSDGVIILTFFMGLIFFLVHKTQSIFISPVLVFLGYGLYDVDFEENGELKQNIILFKGMPMITEEYKVAQLTRFLLFCTPKIQKNEHSENAQQDKEDYDQWG